MINKQWVINILEDGGYVSLGSAEGCLFNKDNVCVRIMTYTQAYTLIHEGVITKNDRDVFIRGDDVFIPYSKASHDKKHTIVDTSDRGYGQGRRMGD
jgi:hypothetical protein